jgi:hypothetical protein
MNRSSRDLFYHNLHNDLISEPKPQSLMLVFVGKKTCISINKNVKLLDAPGKALKKALSLEKKHHQSGPHNYMCSSAFMAKTCLES